MQTDDGKFIEGRGVLDQIKKFYAELYKTAGSIDTTFTENSEIPQLSEQL